MWVQLNPEEEIIVKSGNQLINGKSRHYETSYYKFIKKTREAPWRKLTSKKKKRRMVCYPNQETEVLLVCLEKMLEEQ